MNIGTRLYTWLNGEVVGTDQFGNQYFQDKRTPKTGRRKRWVRYAGAADPTTVPAEWHSWLHYTTDAPLERDLSAKPWMKDQQPNLTGTMAAYLPPGHDLRGGQRERSVADYEAWRP